MYIFGLYLDGARWDPKGGHLSDSLPGQRFSKLPEIHFKPVQVRLLSLSLTMRFTIQLYAVLMINNAELRFIQS